MAKRVRNMTCTQCGANEFAREDHRLRCLYCNSVFEFVSEHAGGDGPHVVIHEGANVVIAKSANVEIRGDVEVEKGAKVKVEGRLKLIEKGQGTVRPGS